MSRITPEIYRIDNDFESADFAAFWGRYMNGTYDIKFDHTYTKDYDGLLKLYKPRIKGYVTFDMDNYDSINSAITYCAA